MQVGDSIYVDTMLRSTLTRWVLWAGELMFYSCTMTTCYLYIDNHTSLSCATPTVQLRYTNSTAEAFYFDDSTVINFYSAP
jgi:hypothetical protein